MLRQLNILFLLLFSEFIFAQNLRLIAPAISDTCGTTADIPIKVKNFNKIISMQGTIGWDAGNCSYNSISSYGAAVIGLTSSNFGYSFTSAGKIVFSWSDASLAGKTLADSTILFTIRLNVTGANGTISNIKFYNSPTVIEFVDSNLNTLNVDTNSGKINIFCNTCGISTITTGNQSSCSFATNTFSQQITVTYSNPPSGGSLIINNQNFSVTGSPQTITLTNLPSDGAGVSVTARFSNDTACKKTINNLFTAPKACRLVTLYTAPLNDTCFTSADVVCKVNGFTKLISAQGSVTWDTSRLSFMTIAGFGNATLGLTNANFGFSQTNNGRLAFSWNDGTLAGKTITDSSQLFIIRFLVKSGTGNTNINFGNNPTTLEFIDSTFNPVSSSVPGGTVNIYCSNNCSITGISTASQGSCSGFTNKYSQTITVTYNNAPSIGNLIVNGQPFAITGSPQTITLTNLNSNGLPVNVTAYFSVNPSCSFFSANTFTAPPSCRRVKLYAPTFNDTCFTTADIPVKVNLFHKIISMQGSIGWDTANAGFNSVVNYGAAVLGLNASNFGTSFTGNGKLTFSWNDASLNGITLADSTILFVLRLNLKTGTQTRIRILSSPTTIEFVDTSFTTLPVDTVSGIINISCNNNCSISSINAGSQSNCDTLTNTYSQTVTVTYSNAPGTGFLVVKNQNFNITGSPQTVTLNNLFSNGLPQTITSNFSIIPSCTFTATNLFTAPQACKKVTFFAPVLTDTCLTTVDVPVKVLGFKKIISMQGTVVWDTSKVQFQTIPFYNSTLGIGSSNFGNSFTQGGKLTFSWNDASMHGITLTDSTTLFTIRYYIKSNNGTSAIAFSNTPTSIETVDSSLITLYTDTISGRVNIYCSGCSITTQPGNLAVCVGASATFTVGLSNSAGAAYQWIKNGSNITGANSASYTIPSIAITDAGNYTVVIGGSCGLLTSNTATLTVNTTSAITTQPGNIAVCAGASATFMVTTTGATSYQWRKNTSNITGATSSTYNISSTATTDAGTYDVLVTNSCGTTTSNSATLTVNTTPVITTQPGNITVCAGASATFTVTATGATSYQWRKNTSNITGATSSSYNISSTATTDAGSYDVLVANSCGTTTSNSATLTVNTTPAITTQPGNISVCAGASATFTVTATGATSYQWRKNTSNITGATSSSYNISSTATTDAGTYDVLVTNSCGTTTSNSATLTVNTTPVITTQPGNITVCAGASATFTVTATAATSYQWRKNTSNITGATSSSYNISSTATTDAGSYDVLVTNSCGTTTSNSATLTVNTTPAITTQPGNITVCAGTSATFTVTATGATSYQWRKNTSNITGATSSSYNISSTTITNAGSYDVLVTNSCGTSTSNAATLTVNTTPAITTQPGNITVCVGASATFTVTATGATSYQWRKNTSNITGATSSSYNISSTATTDAGTYDVLVTNSCGTSTSNAATLTVNTTPAIITQPGNITVCAGASATFTVTATGATSYQWRKNTSNITGATSSSYNISSTATTDAGTYDVLVTNSCGTTTSNSATLTVNTTPAITTQPGNITVCAGASATFTVTATGATSYQWRKNTSNITGATSSSYNISSTATTDAGTYDVLVTNSCGTITSNSATLTVNTIPAITTQPGNITVCAGASATFTVTATGATSYQWRKNTTNITGATSSSYFISSTAITDAGSYDVLVTNSCGTTASNSATLTVNTTPAITTQPGNITVCAGASATFTVTATGATSYQWRKNTSNITGATSSSYNISSTATTDAGTYDVLVTNSCGTTTSNSATLTVNTTPGISTQPGNITVCAGSTATFSITATGATGFQWRKNTANITGANSSSYTIVSTSVTDAGTYDVIVSNACGNTTSGFAILTINTTPVINAQPGSLTVCNGVSATFTVAASGATNYQWRKNTANIPGANTSSYTIPSVLPTDAGTYDVLVTNSCGNTTSNAATLTVNSKPVITSQPANTAVCLGAGATLTVVANGAVSYQWRKNTIPIGGAISASYTIASTVFADSGIYDVLINNICGTTTSNTLRLTVNKAPTINKQPVGQSLCVGDSLVFSVSSDFATNIQWRKNGIDIAGATDSIYKIATVGLIHAGTYTVLISNICGFVISNLAILTVSSIPPKPIITQVGTSLQSSSTSSNQWYRSGILIPGAINQLYPPVQSGYYQVKTGSGNCTSVSDSFYYLHTGIVNPGFKNRYAIHPNPLYGSVNLIIDAEPLSSGTITIFNIQGQLIFSGLFNGNIEIAGERLMEGMNLIKLEDLSGTYIFKLIKLPN